eukprot:2301368-Pyramimonas_sp.AAC.1
MSDVSARCQWRLETLITTQCNFVKTLPGVDQGDLEFASDALRPPDAGAAGSSGPWAFLKINLAE